MNLKEIYEFFDSEENHKELDSLLLNWVLQKQLERIKYQEDYGGVFQKLNIKEKK
jgi:hypothetical protein